MGGNSWDKERKTGGKNRKDILSHLVSGWLVGGHMALQLCAVGKCLTAQGAWEALFILLVAILDVFLEGRQPLVATVTVRAGQQLGKVVWRPGCQV